MALERCVIAFESLCIDPFCIFCIKKLFVCQVFMSFYPSDAFNCKYSFHAKLNSFKIVQNARNLHLIRLVFVLSTQFFSLSTWIWRSGSLGLTPG